MFRDMRNETISGTAREAIACIRRRLPPGWSVEAREGAGAPALYLSGPEAQGGELPLIARASLLPREVPALLAATPPPALVVSAYLSGRARELLAEKGMSYADATGNLRVVLSRPAVFLEGIGADRDPERRPRPLHSLRGAAAGRVVRALAELELPLGVRALSLAAATPLGTVSRVVTLLEDEALLCRDAQRRVVSVERVALLRRWAQDYALTQANGRATFLEPRGLSALWPKLSRLPRYAATGSAAGPGIAPARIAMLYVDDPDLAASLLGLVPAEAGANVWLLRPYDEVVFTRTRRRTMPSGGAPTEVITVSVAQAVVDLASGPGRGPQEAEALLESLI